MSDSSIERAVGRLEGKLDAILEALEAKATDDRERDHRIAKLEQSKAWLLGASAAVSTVVSVLGFFATHIPIPK